MKSHRAHVMLCAGTGCVSNGSFEVKAALEKELAERDLQDEIAVVMTGCNGFCAQGPVMVVQPGEVFYQLLGTKDIPHLVEEHFLKGRPVERLMYRPPVDKIPVPRMSDIGFFKKQRLIALRNRGLIDPEKIDEYIARGGYQGLSKALTEMTPESIVEEVTKSGLRGRGGAGFPTGRKWASAAKHASDEKYIICNADEGDPGAFMDRSIIEGDPHAVIEGMTIAGRAVGAHAGWVYIRTEYPIAMERLNLAISQARDYGLLGADILGSGFDFDIHVFRGAGAFVCGESSALRASIQGDPPEPSAKHIHATERGLFQKPTVLNNVETLANVPEIILRGGEWFAGIGTEGSKGTKVFALVGNVNNTGLVEVPMGTTLREIIFDIGGGMEKGKEFKAVQTGGPSGGCIPASLLDLPVDFDRLTEVGSMMGSGGMIVMDEDTCMVDVARYFLDFLRDESCGKCTACREGVDAMYQIVSRICNGHGCEGDIELLEDLGETIKDTALCGLGTSAPNPVLSTIAYFRQEYETHISERRCPAGVCKALITYSIDAEKCNGCTLCAKNCPENAISGDKKEVHTIDQSKCIKCGICRDVCRREAVLVQ
ncbi:MAG: NADH-quinone oxidoreductase subunit NuoF [Deltaproteobacteria bacterium]|nr:NADH-quinone oxidoreductase subunit NuoF [Deltaproteobacteria bacterium]